MCHNHSHIAVILEDAYTDQGGNRRLEFTSTQQTTLMLDDGSRLILKPGVTFVVWWLREGNLSWSETPLTAAPDTSALPFRTETTPPSGRTKVLILPVG